MSARPERARAVGLYIGVVVAAALVVLALWFCLSGPFLSWEALAAACILAAVSAASRGLPVHPGIGKTSFEASDMMMLVALVLGGPICALLAAAPSALYRDRLRTTFEIANHTIQVLIAAFVFASFSDPLLGGAGFTAEFALGTLAAGCTKFCLDALIGSLLLRIKYGVTADELLKDVVLAPLPSDFINVLTALLTSLTVVHYGPVAALTLFCGVLVSLIVLNLVKEHRRKIKMLGAENAQLREGLLSSNLEFAARLVARLEARDGVTARHAAASAVYAADVARELGLDGERVGKVGLAALLQNVGLVSLPDEVLRAAPEKLNSVGRMHLEQHPVGGEEMLAALPGLEEAAKWVRWHHEREDGTGYPDRLRGAWIPLEAKILAATELYASLALDGPRSPSLSPNEARRELVGRAGTGLDGGVVRAFLRVLDSNDANYASAADDRFVFPATSAVRIRPGGTISPLRPTGTHDARR